MPLTAKGKKLKKKFEEQYGKKKGQSVFYAMENSGKLKKVLKAKRGNQVDTGDFGSEAANDASLAAGNRSVGYGGGDGDPRTGGASRVGQQKTIQPKGGAIQVPVIGPTTYAFNKISKGLYNQKNLVAQKKVDTLGGEMLTKARPRTPIAPRGGNGENAKKIPIIQPIEMNKPIDTTLINPKENFFNFRAFSIGGLSGGVRSGPPPKRGPNPNVPPIKMKKGGYKK